MHSDLPIVALSGAPTVRGKWQRPNYQSTLISPGEPRWRRDEIPHSGGLFSCRMPAILLAGHALDAAVDNAVVVRVE